MPFCCRNQHPNTPGKIWCTECGSLVAGARIGGDFFIISYIRQGSIGAVYLAQQRSLDNRKVVIKILQPVATQQSVQNFRREARILASLSHPYILSIYTFGIVEERRMEQAPYSPYIVLPYAEQGSLEEIFVREGRQPWPLSRVLPIIEEATEALAYAHSRKILHRDVKPANLLMIGSHVALSDFGVAVLIEADKSHITTSWAGSPAFMAPEVWEYRPGRYSDQYALAVTCYWLLTGEYPWRITGSSRTTRNWSYLHRVVPPRSLHMVRPDLPRTVDLVLQHALEKDPHARYSTMKAFARDFRIATQESTNEYFSVPILSTPYSVQKQSSPPQPEKKTPPAVPERKSVPPVVPWQVEAPRPSHIVEIETAPLPEKNTIQVYEMDTQVSSGEARKSKWVRGAFALNVLACLLLAGQAFWLHGGMSVALSLLLVLLPSLLAGPLVARLFRGVTPSSHLDGITWGMLFGIGDTFCSALACYGWATLLYTLPHWGHEWLRAGDGLRIYVEQAALLAPIALTLALYSLGFALGGGAILGLLAVHRKVVQVSL